MNKVVIETLLQLIQRYPILDPLSKNMENAFLMLKKCFNEGGKALICGNGGSAADSEHIVGDQLMKGYRM